MFKKLIILLLIFGCKNIDNPNKKESDNTFEVNNKTISDLVKTHVNWNIKGSPIPNIYQDRYMKEKHYDEIINTIEVADSSITNGIGVVFYRFEVGSKIFRESMWVRKFDSEWLIKSTHSYYPDDDPFENGDTELGEKWIDRANDWEDNSAEWF